MVNEKTEIHLNQVFRVILNEDPVLYQDAFFEYVLDPDPAPDRPGDEHLKLQLCWIAKVEFEEKEISRKDV